MNNSSTGCVLITGGTGRIGSEVARSVLDHGAQPVLFDIAPNPETVEDIADRVLLRQGDVTDMADLVRVIQELGITRIIHLGALLTLQAVARPTAGIAVNSSGTANIFECARSLDVARVVWASSAAVYGSAAEYQRLLGRAVVSESDPPIPPDLYGATKYLNEVLSDQFIHAGADIVGLRPVMTIGVGGLTTGVGILTKAMRSAALTGRGVVTEPWRADTKINSMDVRDCADIFVETCFAPDRLAQRVYNLGTGEYLGLGEMMDIAASMVPGASIEFDGSAAAGLAGVYLPTFDYPDLDSSALRTELGWEPTYKFADAARKAMAEYVAEAEAEACGSPR